MKQPDLFEEKLEIEAWLNNMGIKKYTINSDGTVDVDGDVDISHKKLTKIPVQFRCVDGSFYCRNNNLTSLKGAPREVGGNFWCHDNNLKSEPDHSFIKIDGLFWWKLK